MTGIYIHTPFCLRKCRYCNFFSIEENTQELMDKYVEALIKEIELSLPENNVEHVDTIYFGGGTPSLLTPFQIQSIIEKIEEHSSVSENPEITLEVNPITVHQDYIDELKFTEVNRISLGIQSLDDRELEFLGRLHDSKTAIESLEMLRDNDYNNISVDVIIGLPGQSKESIKTTFGSLLRYSPEHFSAYILSIEKGTKLYEAKVRSEFIEQNDEILKTHYYLVKDLLAKKGYNHYEISSYSVDGMESKHNLKYWKMNEYLGLGAGAHSNIKNKRFENISDVSEYLKNIGLGNIPQTNSYTLDIKNTVDEKVMLGLRLIGGLDLRNIESNQLENLESRLQDLILAGFLIEVDGKIKVPDKYLFITDEIILRLLT